MSQFDLLRSRRFLPVFFTQFFGALNDNVYKNALVIFIAFALADRTAINSSILVIMAGGVFILPFFLFSALAGQLADKYEKSFLIRRIKTAEILIMSFAVTGFITQSVFILMAVLFLMGTQSTFFGPLKYGILPQHLQLHELTGGNGLVQMGTYLAILGGTILGGVLIAVDDSGIYLVSATVVIIAGAGWYASRYIPLAPSADHGLKVDWNIIRQSVRLLRYALAEKSLFVAIIAISWFWFIGATFLSLVPGYTRDVLQGDELVATLLLTAFSIGIGAGSLLCERLSRKRIEPGLVPAGAAGISLFALDLFLAGSPENIQPGLVMGPEMFLGYLLNWRILLDLIGIGFFGGIYIVPLYAMIQHRSSPGYRARIIAATNILNALFMVVSAVLVITLINMALSIPSIYLCVAILNLIVTGAIFTVYPEYLRCFLRLVRSEPGAEPD